MSARPFHLTIKPRGAVCNLGCAYCFYLGKEALFEAGAAARMSDEVLEALVRQHLEAPGVPEVTFGWQGGEPTLMGLDFFRRAVALQARYARPGTTVQNALQTNGVLLDDAWAAFLADHRFLVGLSLDGPRALHDANRRDKGGQPTFDRVVRALARLRAHGVAHNVLCVVSRSNAGHPEEVYAFFRDQQVEFLQFIPAVERRPDGSLTEWSVRAAAWGDFLCGVFDRWVRHDVGRVFVQHFDLALAAWLGLEPSLCVHARTCGAALVIEHTGDLFSCDHYVGPDHLLGNITRVPLAELAASPFQRRFGQDKLDRLPRPCRECAFGFACNGGCPKDRFASTTDGEPGLSYLCAGYRRFFAHVDEPMERMAELVRAGQAPAAIMKAVPRRGEPCACGSGRKAKRCCLA